MGMENTGESEKVKKGDLPVISEENVKRGDFVEIRFTGYNEGRGFDSNIEEDLKTLNPEAKPVKSVLVIGEGMVVNGLDKDLEGKEIDKEYRVKIGYKDAFGERRKELIRTIPLKAFTDKNVHPRPGMMLALDDSVVKIITISGARVITDFNNPLAGKDVEYKYKIVRKIEDDKEKADCLFTYMLRFIPEYEVKDKVVIKGPAVFEQLVKGLNDRFKKMMGKELGFELKERKEESKDSKTEEIKAEQ